MYCPKCGYEYEDGIKLCPDCNVKLVEDVPEHVKEPQFVDLVTIYVAPNYSVVPIAKSILEDAGIKYFVKNEIEQNLIGYTTMFEPIKIMVSKKDAEEAIELLKDLRI